MAVIGEIVIGISAKLDGLDKGVKQTTKKMDDFSTSLRKSNRFLRQMVGGFGTLAIASSAAHKIEQLTKAMAENGSVGANAILKTSGRVETALLDLSDTIFSKAMYGWARLGEEILKTTGYAEKADAAMKKLNAGTIRDPAFRSRLAGGFDGADLKKSDDMIGDMKKQLLFLHQFGELADGPLRGLNIDRKQREELFRLNKELEAYYEKVQKVKDDQKAVEGILKSADTDLRDAYRERNQADPIGSAIDDALALGATDDQLKTLLITLTQLRDIENQRNAELAAEENRVEILEREVAAFEEMQKFVDGVDEGLKGPNEKMDEFIDKIDAAKKANLISDFQADRAIDAERKKLFDPKEKREPVAAAFRGSQDAFSAIARFRNGNQEKIPAQQLREAKETNRLLRRKDAEQEVAGLNN